MVRHTFSNIRRIPLPEEELEKTLEIVTHLIIESCRKARKLGKEHGKKYGRKSSCYRDSPQ